MARNPLVDGLKVVASQLIVLHHMAAYGPLSDAWDAAATRSSDWFFDYGKIAVQVFLVMGGFLAARGLTPWLDKGLPLRHAVRQAGLRYLRLVLPLLAALILAMVCAAWARTQASYAFIPEAPTWGQWLAHALLLHNLLGVDSLSAGVWYVAIDLHLYMLFVGLVYLCRQWARWGVALLMLASLFYFNRDTAFDVGPLYFFGAYALGAMAYWAHRTPAIRWHLAFLLTVGLLALWVDFRSRIAVAVGVALLLGVCGHWKYRTHNTTGTGRIGTDRLASALQTLSNTSYALFLVHFSAVMVANTLYGQLGLNDPLSAGTIIALCWALSMGLSVLFERWVERPLYQLQTSWFQRNTTGTGPKT